VYVGSDSDANGTQLAIGNLKGILAAKGDINFSKAATGGSIFENAKDQNAMTIDAIFTQNGGALTLDTSGLNYILVDLAALKVDPISGKLTGTTA
jgi:hypothetical protein